MSVQTIGWCRVEGAHVPNLGDRYGTFVNLSPSQTIVYFGTPEIMIYHPYDTVNGIAYRVVPLTSLGNNFNTINNIDTNYSALRDAITAYDKHITINNGCYFLTEPITISESSVIFYATSDHDFFEQYSIIYVDDNATPNVVAITADYGGPAIPVGENFRATDIDVHIVYEDLQDAPAEYGVWEITNGVKVLNEGTNIVNIRYEDPDGQVLTTTCVVTGTKNVVSIEARYDNAGPKLADSQKVDRRYISVIAHYTDGSSAFVSDYTLINGTTVTTENQGILTVFYKGKTAQFAVPMYEIVNARLLAYYSGPDVEIGYDWLIDYVIVKIYYEGVDGNGYDVVVDANTCTFSTKTITKEGVNQIQVSCSVEDHQTLSTTMSVTGVNAEVRLEYITAEYRGPEITVGSSFSYERLIVNAHYNNGTVTTVRNYTVPSNVVRNVGNNVYTVTYTERGITKQCDILVIGIPKEDTTQHNLFDIMLNKHYPEMTTVNHRYRGPAEATKMRHYSRFIYDMINKVNDIFISIEKEYKDYRNTVNDDLTAKYMTLNSIREVTDSCNSWLNDKRFTSGAYIMETEE